MAASGVILAAVYLLWAYQRVFHGEPDEENASMPDLSWREGLVMAPLLGLIVFLGVYPKPMLDRIEPSVERLVGHIEDHSTSASPRSPRSGVGHDDDADDTRTSHRGGRPLMAPLFALVSQPLDDAPTAIERVEWPGPPSPRCSSSSAARSCSSSAIALKRRRRRRRAYAAITSVTALAAIGAVPPPVGPGAGRRPGAVLHAGRRPSASTGSRCSPRS